MTANKFILLVALSSCQIAINSFSIPVASKYVVSTALSSRTSSVLSLSDHVNEKEDITSTSSRSSVLGLSSSDYDNEEEDIASTSTKYNRRRALISQALVAPLTIATETSPSHAASEKPPPIIPLKTTAKRLRSVPLFTIVDGNGVPFHTYDKDSAGGFGYFFTTYRSAEYVLDDARKAFSKAKDDESKKKKQKNDEARIGDANIIVKDLNPDAKDDDSSDGEVPDAWGQAQIVTLPLDLVLQLSVKKSQSIATNGKGKKFNTYYQVIPATEDLNAALRIEDGQRYKERGRVPLFYVDDLTIPSTEEGNEGPMNPVYFRIQDLKDEWTKQYPDQSIPTIRVRELGETFREMIKPASIKSDKSVKNLVFVPIPDSVEKAKASGRKYKLGEMILTK